jgi:transposase
MSPLSNVRMSPFEPRLGVGERMSEGLLLMTGSERERACVVRQCVEGRLSQREASERLGVGIRQVKRLVRNWRRDGDAGLVSRQRGRPSHRRLSEALGARIGVLLRENYPDFGPTLAAEKLWERDGIKVSAEMVRRLQIELGLWRPKRRRSKRVFQLRDRRPRFGELIQIDGSPHDWFEGRAPRCTLIVFIDDATGRLTALRFAAAESCKAYLETLREHVLTHGTPLAFYSDRHGIFRVNAKDAEGGDGKTEFGRVMERLEIGLINALTPQAKGRVERANQTLQDRLVKEMRLRGICSMAAGQAFMAEFMHLWNERFAVEPRDPRSVHRPWTKSGDELELMLASREERTLSKALTFSYGGTKYCVNTAGPGTAMRGGKVLVHRLIDGRLHVTYKDRVLRLTAYGSYPVAAPAADEKTLDARVEAIIAAQQTARVRVCRATGGLKPGGFAAPLRGYGA